MAAASVIAPIPSRDCAASLRWSARSAVGRGSPRELRRGLARTEDDQIDAISDAQRGWALACGSAAVVAAAKSISAGGLAPYVDYQPAISFVSLMAGVGIAVVAEVFRRGTQLRAETQGLV